MRALGTGFTCAFVLLGASVANAGPPAAPQVTMCADIKLLRFDWEPVPGASFYRLWIKPGGSRYISVGERIPASITQAEHVIPVHLQDWARTRYVVTACNTSGCSHSAALNPAGLMLDAIGYLKASNAETQDGFGQGVALSDDGYTLAVGALNEASNASGVDGDQADNSSPTSGAIYVFRRRGNAWQQEAYLKAGVNQLQQYFGGDQIHSWHAFALSADGSMLAASATAEDVDGIENAGAVYVFQRTRNVWRLIATLHAPQPQPFDFFGITMDLSDDGRTLKVNSILPVDVGEEINMEMRTHIFVRSGNSWQHSATLAPFYAGDACPSTRLSGDGQTLIMSCQQSATEFRVVTLKRAGDAWVHAADTPVEFYKVRQPIALNPDATIMALAESRSPLAVGIYRWVSGNWVREAGIAAPTLNNPDGSPDWGWDLALGDNGRLLGVSDRFARDGGAGISPVVIPGFAFVGAVYLYQRNDETNTWALRNVAKSPNPGFRDLFGHSISLSASGRTLVVGAHLENSNATGIDGERDNEDAPNAGAAYLY